jgi:integrase
MGWHPSGYWCKKIKGKLYYFGDRGDTSGKTAETDYNRRSPYLFAGQDPDDFLDTGNNTLKKLCNDFMAYKQAEMDDGNLNYRTFVDYLRTCKVMVKSMGKQRDIKRIGPDEFDKMLSAYRGDKSPNTVNGFIGKVKVVFNYALKTNKLDRINYGLRFRTVSPKVLRTHRQQQPSKLFRVEALRAVLDAANVQMRAMILLGINCGFGNADIGRLPLNRIDLESGWHNYGRGKTGVQRRCPLWPETIDAVNDWLAIRKTDTDLVFIRDDGTPWHLEDATSYALTAAFDKLKPPNSLTFYCLRHSFETIGGDSKDQIAVDSIMGHAPKQNDMAANYRHGIADQRLIDVVEFVRTHYLAAIQSSEK